jgi:nucleotide-binding universal stress UspA family protein
MPFRPRRILVATDFSPHARAAADAAAVLARAFDSQVLLLHVIPLTLYSEVASHMGARTFPLADFEAQVRGRAQRDGDQELARLRDDGTEARLLMADGTAAPEIVRVAQEHDCDLVVVGSHGRTGLMRLAMGSVAENVVRLSAAPVFVMRDLPRAPVAL